MKKKLIEKNCGYLLLQPFVYKIIIEKEFMIPLKYAVASGLIKNLNTKLTQNYNNRYVDILVEYYLNSKQFFQIKSLLSMISQRLKNFNTQAERIDYFKNLIQNVKNYIEAIIKMQLFLPK
ncbi:MAG: hypothetical protein ACLUPF_13735 [Dorea sp.]